MSRLITSISSFFLFSGLVGQPLVHEESHHVPIYENEWLRVLEVTAAPGDTTDFHIHQNDIAYYTIQGSDIFLQELGKPPRVVTLPTGWIGSNLTHSKEPFIHRFANAGDQLFKLIAIEVLSDLYSKTSFTEHGEVLYRDERFLLSKPSEATFNASVPTVVLTLDEVQLDLKIVSPKEQFIPKNSTRTVMIQLR